MPAAASSLVPLPLASPSQPTAPSSQQALAEAEAQSPSLFQMPSGQSFSLFSSGAWPLTFRVCFLCSHFPTLFLLVPSSGIPFLLWSACHLPSAGGGFLHPKRMSSFFFCGSPLPDREPVLTQALTSPVPTQVPVGAARCGCECMGQVGQHPLVSARWMGGQVG